ncbi:threonine ammonia-lyase, biosynthetic [bacterium]|nr:MAG: threonine ammonia-lyase, biosynthetic [bacterium]
MPMDVLRAALLARVYDVAVETPLDEAPLLSQRFGNRIRLKREDQQPVFSFKIRGAYNKMAGLSKEALARGVVCASAGNHAQGVALSAQRLGCRAVIVMPRTTPGIKVDAVRSRGAEVVLAGDNFDDANEEARRLEAEQGLTFVHPYDDPEVIAGQATVGLEILRQAGPDIDVVFVAVGGAGLIAGVGAVIKALKPDVKIVAVEPEDADAFSRSMKAGHPVVLDRVGRFADGVATRSVGAASFAIAREVVDETIVVSNDAICAAIKDVFEDRRAILEPAGALAVAGLKAWVERTGTTGQNLVAIACGANVNFDTLRHVSERAELGERREAVLAVTIPERAGSFRQFCHALGDRSITEFNYRYAPGDEAHVFVGVRVTGRPEAARVAEDLRSAGYATLDLSDDETAKLHVRHMVGGRSSAPHERIFSFAFPERAGALAGFLDAMAQPWNISLFHYRNHGADYGRVLCGMQVPPEEAAEFRAFLDGLGFEWSEATDDPAVKRFL